MKSYLRLRLNNFFAALIFSTTIAYGQPDGSVSNDPPFVFPLKPGQPASLAGTMGEPRGTHLHAGLDIRTYNQIGWPVIAPADGYVSRIRIGPSGYGNALYITHPGGNITLYGHLDRFRDDIQQFMLAERYRRKVSAINVYPEATKFVIKKGDTIAFSGNTGSSGGPHLHFEIRDSNNKALNPLLFGFSEVTDDLPPVPEIVAFKTMDAGSRINQQFGRFEFHARKSGKGYTVASPILAYGRIGIELKGYDILNVSPQYRCGINYMEVRANDKLIFTQKIEEIDFNENNLAYTLMNYPVLSATGNRFIKTYIDDGNRLNYYNRNLGSGYVTVRDEPVAIEITLMDSYGNKSTVNFILQPDPPAANILMPSVSKSSVLVEHEIMDNTFVLKSAICPDGLKKVWVYSGKERKEAEPAYCNDKFNFYLLDLRTSLPDSVVTCNGIVYTNLRGVVYPSSPYTFYGNRIEARFAKNAVFDTLYLQSKYEKRADGSEVFTLGPATTPFNTSCTIFVKPEKTYDQTDKRIGLYRMAGRSHSFVSNTWQNGRLTATTSDLGSFTILTDSIPPTITPVFVDKMSARFKITDNLSGIADFTATLNGKWVLMEHDAKTYTIWAVPPIPGQELVGEFVLTVVDNAGNRREFRKTIR